MNDEFSVQIDFKEVESLEWIRGMELNVDCSSIVDYLIAEIEEKIDEFSEDKNIDPADVEWKVTSIDHKMSNLALPMRGLSKEDILEMVVTAAELIDKYGEAFITYLNLGYTNRHTAWEEDFNDRYQGKMTLEEYARQAVEDGFFGDVSEDIKFYINYDKLANDLRSQYTEENGYLFDSY